MRFVAWGSLNRGVGYVFNTLLTCVLGMKQPMICIDHDSTDHYHGVCLGITRWRGGGITHFVIGDPTRLVCTAIPDSQGKDCSQEHLFPTLTTVTLRGIRVGASKRVTGGSTG
jgi:hypothetical protein